jgi:methyl-accepting chemotaxis protein
MKKASSLSQKLFRQLIVIVLIGQALTMALVYVNRMRVEEKEVAGRVGLFGKIVASSAHRAFLDNDLTYLTLLIRDILDDEDVLSVVVKDSRGQEYAYTGERPKLNRQSALVELPIRSREGEVGSVKIACTFDNIREKLIGHILALVALQALVVLLLMAVIRYFFRKDLGSNLEKVGHLFERVREGDLTTRIGSSDQMNEIVAIANGLDFLVDHLAGTIRKMNRISDNLRNAVDRTKQVTGQLVDDAHSQQRGMDLSFQILNEASQSQAQIIDHTSRLQGMAQTNGDALADMRGTFEGIVHTIDSLDTSMATLHSSINELSHSSREVAALAERAAASVQDVSGAMSAIGVAVKDINDVVHETTQVSERATESISSKGIAAVGNAIDTTERIESFFNSLSATILRLDARSKDVARIVNVIREVTEQVKLLSLNAQIIAGQSGESGRSFGVVAREMKLLATKAGLSAKEIESILGTIQHEIASAVSETEETAQAVREGKSVAVMTGEVIDEILELSSSSTRMVQAIAASTRDQNRLIESVNRDMDRLRELNQKVKSATGEEELSTVHIMNAAHVVSRSLGETRRATEEQFRSLKTIAVNTRDANTELEDIAMQSSRQLTINGDIIESTRGNLAMAEAMVTAVRRVSLDLGSVFLELERLREEMGFFRTGD